MIMQGGTKNLMTIQFYLNGELRREDFISPTKTVLDYLRINAEISCSLGTLCNRFKAEASRHLSLSNYDSFTIVMSSNSCPYGGMAFVRGNCFFNFK